MRIVDHEDLPKWVHDLYAKQTPRFVPGLWTVDDQGDYHMWSTLGSFHKRTAEGNDRKMPKGVDPKDIVDWYSLPTRIKGSYRTDAEMHHLKSLTWVKGSNTTYFAYGRDGRYAGMWETEGE